LSHETSIRIDLHRTLVTRGAPFPVLGGMQWEVRRTALIDKRRERDGKTVYTFDIRLPDTPDGGRETVFFDI